MRRPVKAKCPKSARYPNGWKYFGAVEHRGRQAWVGTFATADEWNRKAETVMGELREDAGIGRLSGAHPTVAEYLGVVLDANGRVVPRPGTDAIWPWTRLRGITKDSSARTLAENIRPLARTYGDRRVDSFSRLEAQEIARKMTNGQKAAVRRLFSDLLDDELVPRNVFERLSVKQRPRITREDFRIVSDAEFERLLDCALRSRSDDFRYVVHAIILTQGTIGARPSSIFAIERANINCSEGSLSLVHNIDDYGAVTSLKGGRRHLAPFTAEMEESFARCPKLSDRWQFTAPRGGLLKLSNWSNYWNPARVAAGLPDLEFYELKHRAISHMCAPAPDGLGMDPAYVAELVGHNDGGATIRRYYLKLDEKRALAAFHRADRQRRSPKLSLAS